MTIERLKIAKKFDPTQLCNNLDKKEVQGTIVKILGCLDALGCLTKPIRENDPYDYYVEQEWRMVIPVPHQSNRVFMGKGIRKENGERINCFIRIPFETLDCIVCPNSDYKEKLATLFKNLKKNFFKIISFDELPPFLKGGNS